MLAHLNPHSSNFGDICALYSPVVHQLTMQSLLFLNLGVYGLVQATVGIGTVLIWDFGVAFTRGGGYVPNRVHRICVWSRRGIIKCTSLARGAVPDRSFEAPCAKMRTVTIPRPPGSNVSQAKQASPKQP